VGTAAEVSAINSVDDRDVPCPGPITLQVADIYGKAVRGQLPQYKDWLELA
jgi:branched-chain amino acid aminotransferase